MKETQEDQRINNNSFNGTISTIPTILSFNKRQHSFWCSEDVYKTFRRIAALQDKSVSQLLEEIMVDYIENFKPPEFNITINLHKPADVSDLVTKLKLKLTKQELSTILNSENQELIQKRLKRVLPEAVKLYEKTGDEEIQSLLSKGKRAIERRLQREE